MTSEPFGTVPDSFRLLISDGSMVLHHVPYEDREVKKLFKQNRSARLAVIVPSLTFALVISCLGVGLCNASQADAQQSADGPMAMALTYKAIPGKRISFRELMATQGIAQFEQWKAAGAFESYQALFSAYAASDSPDLFVVLRFRHFSDLGRWQTIEQRYPGGLIEAAQPLAFVETSATVDIVSEGSVQAPKVSSQYVVLEYDVTAPMPKYVSYVQGYVAPQFEGWMKAGILSSYACFANQNPAGAAWTGLIVLQYKDLAALGAREVVKDKTRAMLATTDPVWKRWSEDKSDLRREKLTVTAVALP